MKQEREGRINEIVVGLLLADMDVGNVHL